MISEALKSALLSAWGYDVAAKGEETAAWRISMSRVWITPENRDNRLSGRYGLTPEEIEKHTKAVAAFDAPVGFSAVSGPTATVAVKRAIAPAAAETTAQDADIDVPALRAQIEAACQAHNARHPAYPIDPVRALEAELHNRRILAFDRSRMGPVIGGGTPGESDPVEASATAVPEDLAARAAALKIDVAGVTAAAVAAKMDPVAALKAEISNRELMAKDAERRGPVIGLSA